MFSPESGGSGTLEAVQEREESERFENVSIFFSGLIVSFFFDQASTPFAAKATRLEGAPLILNG